MANQASPAKHTCNHDYYGFCSICVHRSQSAAQAAIAADPFHPRNAKN